MKRLQYLIVSLLVLALAACQDNTFEIQTPGTIDANGNILIRFSTEVPDMEVINTRAVDPDGYGTNSLWLFCFDQFRHYIGHVQAQVTEDEATQDKLHGTFTATIPGSTRHLHFIANLNVNDFEDAPNLGRLDTEVIPRFTTTSGLLCYWGYKSFASEEELAAFATGTGETAYLFRNQARIRYQREGEGASLSIKGMAIMNQYSRGTVAPYNKNAGANGNPFAFNAASDIKEPTLCADDDVLVATDPTDVVQFGGESVGNFVFEHANEADDPMYFIFRINTTGGSAEDGNWKDDDKYYKIALVDGEGRQLPVLRNYDYVVNFKGIPEAGGYATFDDAVRGPAANNVWVSIDQTIPSITDGISALAIQGETTQIITEKSLEAGNTYKIYYTWFDGTGNNIVPEVTWLENSGIATAQIDHTFTPGSSREVPGQGTVTIHPEAIGAPQYGTIQVKAGKFVRTVKLISLKNFSFTPVWTSSGLPMKSGEPVSIMFTIPDNFPTELFPLDVKLACNLFDDDGTNVDMDGNLTFLDVVTEVCDFTVMENGKEVNYKRDWPHKYLYTVNRPGLHRINFKTLVDNYTPNPGEDPRIEFFLEAEAFTTIRSLIYMNENNTNYRIALGTDNGRGGFDWASGNSASVTVPPAAGQKFNLHFKFYNGMNSVQPVAGEVLRLYLDITKMLPETTGTDLSKDPIYDPDKGYYYTYTVPSNLRDTYNEQGVVIPMITQSSDCNTYLRVSSQLNSDGTFPSGSRVYRSAILTIGNMATYDFNVTLSDGSTTASELGLKYGPGIPVNMKVTFPLEVLTYRPEGFTGFIATKYLTPASDETRLTPVDGGYTFEATTSDLTFQFVTNTVGSAEVITVSELGNKIAFNSANVEIRNSTLEGKVKITDATFDVANPFMSLEREDGTRIGVLAVVASKGANEGKFTLELRTEYKLDMDEQVFVRYSPITSGDERLFTGYTTLREMQDNPDEPIVLQLH